MATGDVCGTLRKMKAGDEIVLPVKKQRNPRFHRLFFSWLNTVFANQDKYETPEQLRLNLMLMTGRIKTSITKSITGWITCESCGHKQNVNVEKTALIPESISFENMGEDEFHAVQKDFDKVLMAEGINVEIGFH